MADFFKTLESQGGEAPPRLLSDHPNRGNREQAIEKEIRNWPPENYVSDSPAFQKVRQHAMGVKAYTGAEISQGAKSGEWAALNKRNGAAFNPTGGSAAGTSASAPVSSSSPNAPAVSLQTVLPSQRMLTSDLGPVKIGHPENCQVTIAKQQGQFLTIAPQAGITANGMGYGVPSNCVALPKGERISIDDVTVTSQSPLLLWLIVGRWQGRSGLQRSSS